MSLFWWGMGGMCFWVGGSKREMMVAVFLWLQVRKMVQALISKAFH